MITGEEIRAARERAHLSQQQLARRLDVSLRTVGNWERGETVPRNREASIIEVLGLSAEEGAANSGDAEVDGHVNLSDVPTGELLEELGRRATRGQTDYQRRTRAQDAAESGDQTTEGWEPA